MSRLWIFISYLSQVFDPSPQGYTRSIGVSGAIRTRKQVPHTVFRVVIFSTFVGRRTGPLTRSCLSLARSMSSPETAREYKHPPRILEI